MVNRVVVSMLELARPFWVCEDARCSRVTSLNTSEHARPFSSGVTC